MKLRACKESDLEDIKHLLEENKLPFDDIAELRKNIVVAENDKGEFIGIGALEIYGKIGLFRSLVVAKNARNKTYGSIIYKHVEDKGKNIGVRELYLLTENACKYFENLGFTEVVRDTVPVEIKNTNQFSSLCPASARIMRKYL